MDLLFYIIGERLFSRGRNAALLHMVLEPTLHGTVLLGGEKGGRGAGSRCAELRPRPAVRVGANVYARARHICVKRLGIDQGSCRDICSRGFNSHCFLFHPIRCLVQPARRKLLDSHLVFLILIPVDLSLGQPCEYDSCHANTCLSHLFYLKYFLLSAFLTHFYSN